jgi:hypothetical protein
MIASSARPQIAENKQVSSSSFSAPVALRVCAPDHQETAVFPISSFPQGVPDSHTAAMQKESL